MACNIEGMIDLGEDRKVELFMHLLSQWGKSKDKVVLITKIKKFVDDVVCKDIRKWKTIIKRSGYLSK